MATNDNLNAEIKTAAQKRFPQSLSDANDVRLSALNNLVHLAEAHVDSVKQDQARLAAKYGRDAKQTRAAAEALTVAQVQLPQFEAELFRTKIKAPKSDANAVIVYGRILSKTYSGVAGVLLTVVSKGLTNSARQLQARTDADGEFVLSLPAQDGTQTLEFEIRDEKGVVSEIEDTFTLRAGNVIYREYLIDPQQN